MKMRIVGGTLYLQVLAYVQAIFPPPTNAEYTDLAK